MQVIVAQLSQNQKERNSKRHPRRQNGVYLLSGISRCSLCGSPHYGLSSHQRNGAVHLRYACTQAQRRHDCAAKPIPAKFYEENILDHVIRFFDDPQNIINMLTVFQQDNSSHQARVDEEHASLSAQLATVRKAVTHLTNAISESGHSSALLKKLSASETQEADLLAKISKLKTQTVPPIFIPSIEQARAMSNKISEDLRSKDRVFIHRVLMGIIHEVRAAREGHHLRGKITFFHTPESKKKALSNTVSLSSLPVGAPTYRHSISLEGTIPSRGRPRKKPVT